jgi:hypothetical protein
MEENSKKWYTEAMSIGGTGGIGGGGGRNIPPSGGGGIPPGGPGDDGPRKTGDAKKTERKERPDVVLRTYTPGERLQTLKDAMSDYGKPVGKRFEDLPETAFTSLDGAFTEGSPEAELLSHLKLAWEARQASRKRIDDTTGETQDLLDETLRATEQGLVLPGYLPVSPPPVPDIAETADDGSVRSASGGGGGNLDPRTGSGHDEGSGNKKDDRHGLEQEEKPEEQQ